MKTVRLHDKEFRVSIPNEEITRAVGALAERVNADHEEGTVPLFLPVLNGAFMFAAELLRRVSFPCELSFVKLASYQGERSTGGVRELIGLGTPIEGRDIIVVEDIVDTGSTYGTLRQTLERHKPRSCKIATLLLKPEVYKMDLPIEYAAIRIPNDFVVGYGLDYNGLGRNLPDIYTVIS